MPIALPEQVETVATWAGLLTGVSGTVLAIVAIWFAAVVDRRSRDSSNLTIQSMQKVESAVERISTDTGGLIRAAWERMLGTVGSVGPEPSDRQEDSAKSIAAGIAAELRAELLGSEGHTEGSDTDGNDASPETGAPPDAAPSAQTIDHMRQLDRVVARLERTVEAQLLQRDSEIDPVKDGIDTLRRIAPPARALIRMLANNGHLERSEYQRLRRMAFTREALSQLRAAGLLVPLTGDGDADNVVYWIPKSRLPSLGAALLTAPPDSTDITDQIQNSLEAAGYLPRVRERRERSSQRRQPLRPRENGSGSSRD